MSSAAGRSVRLPDGETAPALGQGTWMMGEGRTPKKQEIAALQLGIDLGMTLIDTAEMYGDGGAEEIVADAIAGRRDRVFVVSKVLPGNASRSGTVRACEASLKRMGIDAIDLYLLHWRGHHPLAETVAAFEALRADGKIRHWGVSNFDLNDMGELAAVAGGAAVAVNQLLYNPSRRGIEFDLLPWQTERAIPTMAYSPIEQGRLARDATMQAIAKRHGASPAQIAIAWTLRRGGIIAIPKASTAEHVRANRAALDIVLDGQDIAEIDAAFPPLKRKQPLEMI